MTTGRINQIIHTILDPFNTSVVGASKRGFTNFGTHVKNTLPPWNMPQRRLATPRFVSTKVC